MHLPLFFTKIFLLDAKEFLAKAKGGQDSPARAPTSEILWSWVGSFLAISCIAAIDSFFMSQGNHPLIIASLGASAVLTYGAPQNNLAQPRNLVGGHVLSAFVGVTCFKLFSDPILAGAMAVSTAIALMHLTKTLHPPGGATALIAVIGSESIHQLGYWYVLMPCGVGAGIVLLIGVLFNNLSPNRRYPRYWW